MLTILKMIVQRLALGLITLFVVSLIIFLGVELLPGDLTEAILGQSATPETVAAFRRELGLDLPPHTRYLQWLGEGVQEDTDRIHTLRVELQRERNALSTQIRNQLVRIPLVGPVLREFGEARNPG